MKWIYMRELSVLIIFSKGGKAFIDTLLPRLNAGNMNGGPCMPFMIEVSLLHSNSLFLCAEMYQDTCGFFLELWFLNENLWS